MKIRRSETERMIAEGYHNAEHSTLLDDIYYPRQAVAFKSNSTQSASYIQEPSMYKRAGIVTHHKPACDAKHLGSCATRP